MISVEEGGYFREEKEHGVPIKSVVLDGLFLMNKDH